MPNGYSDPVAALLTYGGFDIRRNNEPWPNYLELGFKSEHVAELVRMMEDLDLSRASQESLEVWAPLHAWRTLGQLGAVEAAKPVVRLFDKLPDDDWLPIELPKVLSLMGPDSAHAIAEFMADASIPDMRRISAPACLEQLALEHPAGRAECIDLLEHQLVSYEKNGECLNAFIILSLTKLQATETIETIRQAFNSEKVDLSVLGDVEDVEIELGLRATRETPAPKVQLVPGLPSLDEQMGWLDTPERAFTDRALNPFRHVGRNDPCPCGSGKKFKKCCGAG